MIEKLVSLEHKDALDGLRPCYVGKAPSNVLDVLTCDDALHLFAASQHYRHDLNTGKLLSRHSHSAAKLCFALEGVVFHGGLLWSVSWQSGSVFALRPETSEIVFEQKIARQNSLRRMRQVGSTLCVMRDAEGSNIEPLAFNLDTRTLHSFPVAPLRYDHDFQFAGVDNGKYVAIVGEGLCAQHFPDPADALVRVFDTVTLQEVDTGNLADIWQQPRQWHYRFDDPIVAQADSKLRDDELPTLLFDRFGATRIPGHLYRFSNTWQVSGEHGRRLLLLNDQMIQETAPDRWHLLPEVQSEISLPLDLLRDVPNKTQGAELNCDLHHLSLTHHRDGGWLVSVPFHLRIINRQKCSIPHGNGLIHYRVAPDFQCSIEPQAWLTNPMNSASHSSGMGPRVKCIGSGKVVCAPGRYYLLDGAA